MLNSNDVRPGICISDLRNKSSKGTFIHQKINKNNNLFHTTIHNVRDMKYIFPVFSENTYTYIAQTFVYLLTKFVCFKNKKKSGPFSNEPRQAPPDEK